MATKPSYGVIFHPKFPPETLVDFARQAEAAGLDELWLWEDCFYAGALTSAAVLLAATQRIRVGIGILPVTVRNPLFTAMEITTLARLYPGRLIPGFGHGVAAWMKQIGAYPSSPLSAMEETVTAVRGLLEGEMVTLQGSQVHLDRVRLELTPAQVPPLYVGGIREKTLRLAGRVGDGAILTAGSSPAYVRWAGEQIAAGAAEAGRSPVPRAVFVLCRVDPDGAAARAVVRRTLAGMLPGSAAQLAPLGIAAEAAELVQKLGVDEAAQQMPDAWVDALSASGTPQQAAAALAALAEAGADSIILEPVGGRADSLAAYIRYLLPVLKG